MIQRARGSAYSFAVKGAVGALVACMIATGCVTITFLEVEVPPTAPAAAAIPSTSTTAIAPTSSPTQPVQVSPRPSSSASAVPPSQSPQAGPTPVATASVPPTGVCADDAYTLTGYRWTQILTWRFQESSTPARYSSLEVLDVLMDSFENITAARNDCGRPDNVRATALYLGTTLLEPCEADVGDGSSVIGFGRIPRSFSRDTIASTCPYEYSDGSIAEVDILINEDIPWALSAADCAGLEEMLEATITHEIGHAFGLGHVSERNHGDLTMSTKSNGPCTNEESTLGLGDLLGLEELYPPD